MKKTKILATLGPACDDVEIVKEMLLAGANAFRFNFSHGDRAQHTERLERARQACRETGIPAAFVLDTKGPEIRLKSFQEGAVELFAGDPFTLHTIDMEGDRDGVSVTWPRLKDSLSPGDAILLDDGLVELKVKKIDGEAILCQVVNGGELSNNKSLNVPAVSVKMPALSAKDIDDMRFAIENDFDFIAASFIRSADDVHALRGVLEAYGGESIRIIAKIENAEGVRNAQAIIEASDGLMVARGDLGVELPPASLPVIQKDLIRRCNAYGKPVITATQMLDSMIRNPRPTRAEVADVANAVFDGSDCVMLSGETAAGKFPVASVATMAQIISEAESRYEDFSVDLKKELPDNPDITNTIGYASVLAARVLGAGVILTPTRSGYTARMIAKFRPSAEILATTTEEKVVRRLCLSWGVETIHMPQEDPLDDLIANVFSLLLERGSAKPGDMVVITAGLSNTVSGTTNTLRVEPIPKVGF